VRGVVTEILDLVLPPVCGGCLREVERERALCAACDAQLPRIPAARCRVCQERGPSASGRCQACAARPTGRGLDACIAEAAFEGAAARWVRRFKYAGRGLSGLDPAADAVALALVRAAARRLAEQLPWRPEAIVPVPAHPRRRRRRGFHAAGVLARAVAEECGAPIANRLLRRVRDTPSQTGHGSGARRRNVAGAFDANGRAPGRVWLVDDVVTTGATLGEAALVLRRAGARQVAAVCAARTPRPASARERVEGLPANRYNPSSPEEAPEMATLKQDVTLKHQPNLGEEIEEISFEAGTKVTVLKEWSESSLCKNESGQLFNISKDLLE
jgi:ComF family protein